jgi:hypothetical protein
MAKFGSTKFWSWVYKVYNMLVEICKYVSRKFINSESKFRITKFSNLGMFEIC